MIYVKYMMTGVSIWSYSLISITVCLVVGLIASWIYNAVTGKKSEAPRFTVYSDFKKGLKEEKVEAAQA